MYGFGLSTDHANLINKGKKKKKVEQVMINLFALSIAGLKVPLAEIGPRVFVIFL